MASPRPVLIQSSARAAASARPAWPRGRANKLHCLFQRAEQRSQNESLAAALQTFTGFWKRGKKVRLSLPRLYGLFVQWQKNGRTPDALRLHYKGLSSSLPGAVLCRFVELAARQRFDSMRAAGAEFSRRNGWIGRGRRPLRSRCLLSYGQLQYFFPASKFKRLQAAQVKIQEAARRLNCLRLQFIAEIRNRLPDRPARKRRPANYDI